MRRLLFVTAIFMSIYVWANSSRTSDVVSDFYYQIKIIAEHPKDSEMSFEARDRVTDMSCDTEGSGWFPNEFVDDPNSQQKLRAYNYALKFASLSEETNPSFSYKIVSQNKYVEPEWEKNEAESNFSYTIVDKSYTYKGVKKNVRDTIIIANFTNQILGVMNKYGGYDFTIDENESDFPNPSPITTPTANTNNDVLHLQAAAAHYYDAKNYDKAYQIYRKVIEKDKENADAYYRLAIMSYRRQGCKQYKRKQTDTDAMTYMEKAKEFGTGELRNRAYNLLKYWDRGYWNI